MTDPLASLSEQSFHMRQKCMAALETEHDTNNDLCRNRIRSFSGWTAGITHEFVVAVFVFSMGHQSAGLGFDFSLRASNSKFDLRVRCLISKWELGIRS